LRQAFAGLWNRLSTLWKVVIVLATLASLTFIFDIPHRVEPTALTLKDGQGDEEGDEVEWEIR
jgi:hypothetical protein